MLVKWVLDKKKLDFIESLIFFKCSNLFAKKNMKIESIVYSTLTQYYFICLHYISIYEYILL
jgi:hypothetical protein